MSAYYHAPATLKTISRKLRLQQEIIMCVGSSEWIRCSIYMHKHRPKRSKLQVYRLKRRKRMEEVEMRNLKLYMENMSILQENEKLRKKASLLHQENLALLSKFQQRFSNSVHLPASAQSTPSFV